MVRLSRCSLKQWKLKGWIGYLLFFLFGALLTFWGYTYLTREKRFSPEDFSQKVYIADHIIQSQLFVAGLSRKEILLHRSLSKREGDIAWEQSLLTIQVPRSLSFSLIEGNFKRSLSPLGKSFSIQSSQALESLQLEVKVMNRITLA